MDCKIYTFEYRRKENNEKYPKLIYTTNIKEYEEKEYYYSKHFYIIMVR
ncbi:hypothetical protein [Candidatus Nanopusillus massiliensis]|nr:hypothetical protein [Candidatus Nanopusillus massiliensis]